ncbi:MAG: phosphatase PAP2 family protein [Thermoanaerobaculia bacterium]|jgi:membrane-associated phospholipid phosphatase
MSTSFRDVPAAQGRASAVAATLFIALLACSITWPDPVLAINRAFFNVPLDVNEVSFLGREAPRWDVVYWWIVGLALIGLVHGRTGRIGESWPCFAADLRGLGSELWQRCRRPRATSLLAILIAGSALVALSYRYFDMAAIAASTGWRSDWLHDWIRLSNRLGGGANPPMIVLFFVVAGLALGRRDWWRLGSAMAVAGLVAGAAAGLMKRAVQRSRPDAWLGHDVFGLKGETSFPSGHTIGAFALMVVILVGARSRFLRVAAVVVAISVAAARVLALRHWPSDVLMSATLGTIVGLFVGAAIVPSRDDEPEEQ